MTESVFPFVVGCGRSGTTLVRAMLDSHPELAVPPESYFVVGLGKNRERYEHDDDFLAERFISDLMLSDRFRRWEIPASDVRHELAMHPTRSFADAVRRVFELYAQRRGKSRFGDKTPSYVLQLPMLAGLFPEARFIHVIRDGRDVALSLAESKFGPMSISEAAVYWRSHVEAGRRAGSALGTARYAEVRYERLLDEPDTVLREVCDFIELAFDPSMMRYHERASEIIAGVRQPERHQHLNLPPSKGLRDWRQQMDKEQLIMFESAGEYLERVGYERATDESPAAADGQRVWPQPPSGLRQAAHRFRIAGRRAAHRVLRVDR